MTETPNPHIVDADTITGEMRPIRRAVLALGSNLGERLTSLQGAVDALKDTPDVFVTAISPVYETEPVHAPDGSGLYLNAVVLIDTTLSAPRLLDRALAIEDAFDRERTEVRNAPRTLDVDLIVVGDRRSDTDDLRLPHPRARRARLRAPAVARRRARRGVPRAATRSPTCSRRPTAAWSPGATTWSSSSSDGDPSGGPLGPPGGTDPDPAPGPAGTLRQLGPGAVVVALCLGLVVGWLVRRVAAYADTPAPLVSWTQAGVLFLAAAILGVLAWHTRRALDGTPAERPSRTAW